MIIRVEMTETEAADFLDFRRNQGKYKTAESRLNMLCQKVKDAIAPAEGAFGCYEILDQDHADDLWETCQLIR